MEINLIRSVTVIDDSLSDCHHHQILVWSPAGVGSYVRFTFHLFCLFVYNLCFLMNLSNEFEISFIISRSLSLSLWESLSDLISARFHDILRRFHSADMLWTRPRLFQFWNFTISTPTVMSGLWFTSPKFEIWFSSMGFEEP